MNIKKILKDLTSSYDPTTKKIRSHGKLSYLHEYRHSKQPHWIMFIVSIWFSIIVAMVAVASFRSQSWFLFLISFPPVLIIGLLEADAWVYALRKRYNKTQ